MYPKYLKSSNHSNITPFIFSAKLGTGRKLPQRNKVRDEFVLTNIEEIVAIGAGIMEDIFEKGKERMNQLGWSDTQRGSAPEGRGIAEFK